MGPIAFCGVLFHLMYVSLPGFIEVFLVDLVCPIFDCGAVLGAISPTVVRCREGDGLDVANAVARGFLEEEVWSDIYTVHTGTRYPVATV